MQEKRCIKSVNEVLSGEDSMEKKYWYIWDGVANRYVQYATNYNPLRFSIRRNALKKLAELQSGSTATMDQHPNWRHFKVTSNGKRKQGPVHGEVAAPHVEQVGKPVVFVKKLEGRGETVGVKFRLTLMGERLDEVAAAQIRFQTVYEEHAAQLENTDSRVGQCETRVQYLENELSTLIQKVSALTPLNITAPKFTETKPPLLQKQWINVFWDKRTREVKHNVYANKKGCEEAAVWLGRSEGFSLIESCIEWDMPI